MQIIRKIGALACLFVGACGASDHAGDADAPAGTALMVAENVPSLPLKGIPLGRLPDTARPTAYALELTVIPNEERFSGHIEITLELQQATDHLYLHGRGLQVEKSELLLPDGKRLDIEYEQLNDGGVAMVRFGQQVEAGRVRLDFDYSAAFDRRLHGIYKVEEGGEAYVFTQMESVYARQAFPGFDEPAFKTPFELSLVIRQEHEAIANMPVVDKQLLDGGLKRLRFANSDPMPTYLLALAVGPLEIVEGKPISANTVRNTALPLRGVAIKDKGQDLRYALDHTGAIVQALEEYFDMPYPYAKLDIIAVPDFEAGAMENIGAITFRERLLLLKDDAPPHQKRSFTRVMAHELAHMWFGNLVTMPWWDDIWLNEAFATWMAYKAVAQTNPEYKSEIAQIRRTQSAMREDALVSARQIREPVVDNDGIVEAFDGITYAKGGAVLTMFEQYLGADVFREGVRDHMRRFAHGSADVNDLIESLAKASGKAIAPAFNSFLFQGGIPIVAVTVNCDAQEFSLSQSRYLPTGSDGDPNRTWQVPVCITYGSASGRHEECTLLEKAGTKLPFDGPCPDWLVPNTNFAGYYHWFLSPPAYANLGNAGNRLSEREWMSAADSVKAGMASGRLAIGPTWDAIEMFARSDYPNVARAMMPTIRYMLEYLTDDPKLRATMRLRAAQLYAPLNAYRAFDREFVDALPDSEQRQHFSNVASFMAEVVQDEYTRARALEKALAYLDGGDKKGSVSTATLETIFTVGVQDGGHAFADELRKRFEHSNDALFRDTALSALAKTRDPQLAQQVLAMTLGEQLRSNEIRRVITAHVEELGNVVPAWLWLEKNYDALVAKMPARHIPKLTVIAGKMCEVAWIDRVDSFLRPRLATIPGGPRNLNTTLEKIQICAASVPQQFQQARAHFISAPRR